ncbi:unnamed protein product [Prunus armeniaca]
MDRAMASVPKVPVTSILGLVPPFICLDVGLLTFAVTCPKGEFALTLPSATKGTESSCRCLPCPRVLFSFAIDSYINKSIDRYEWGTFFELRFHLTKALQVESKWRIMERIKPDRILQ